LTGAAGDERYHGDARADSGPLDAFTHGGDDARRVNSENQRQADVRRIFSLAHNQIQCPIHRHRMNLHQNFAGPG
jgi:hypothetical protein